LIASYFHVSRLSIATAAVLRYNIFVPISAF